MLFIWVPLSWPPFILQFPLKGPHTKWAPVMVLIGMLFNTNTPQLYKSPETQLRIDYSYQYYAEITNQATQRGLTDCASAIFIIMRHGFFRSLSRSLCSFSSSIIQSRFEMNHWLLWQQIASDFQAFIIHIEYNLGTIPDFSRNFCFMWYNSHNTNWCKSNNL